MDILSRTIRPILNQIPNPFAAMASTSSSVTPNPAMASAKELVEKTINENFVAFFSKSYCSYCRRAKAVINELNLGEGKAVKVYELDQREDGEIIQEYLCQKTGQRSVPNIFINTEHIGGSDDLAAAKASGKLAKLVAA